MLAQYGDSAEPSQPDSDGLFVLPPGLPDDDRRWWDLTDNISGRRLIAAWCSGWIGCTRLHRRQGRRCGFGRQAVSWGNGLIFNPMDFFNPFNPAAVDTEYKLGEDMLYGQYLLDNGSDWQLVNVQRRDEQGNVTSAVSSTALKFHGFGLEREYDLLLAEHFDQLYRRRRWGSLIWASRWCAAISPLPMAGRVGHQPGGELVIFMGVGRP